MVRVTIEDHGEKSWVHAVAAVLRASLTPPWKGRATAIAQDTRAGNGERGSEAARQQAERFADVGREGMRRATEASRTAANGVARSGSALAEGAQEITAAWARYAEEVMRHTSEASQALLRAPTFNEMLIVQARLLRDNMQLFLDQSTRIAEAATRMATRPFDALKEASAGQTRR